MVQQECSKKTPPQHCTALPKLLLLWKRRLFPLNSMSTVTELITISENPFGGRTVPNRKSSSHRARCGAVRQWHRNNNVPSSRRHFPISNFSLFECLQTGTEIKGTKHRQFKMILESVLARVNNNRDGGAERLASSRVPPLALNPTPSPLSKPRDGNN